MTDYVTPDLLSLAIASNNSARFEMTLAKLSTYTGTANLVFVVDDGGKPWIWRASGVANGDNIRAAASAKGGVWERQVVASGTGTTDLSTLETSVDNLTQRGQAQMYAPSADMQKVLGTTEGHNPTLYRVGLGSTAHVVSDLGITSTNPSDHYRFWGTTSTLYEPFNSKNLQPNVALNARMTTNKQGGYAGAALFLSGLNREQITGRVTLTAGSATATSDASGKFLTDLKAPVTNFPLWVFFCGNSHARVPIPTGQPAVGGASDGLPGIAVEVAAIVSNTQLTLKSPWAGPSGTYFIYRTMAPNNGSAAPTSAYPLEVDSNNFTAIDANDLYDTAYNNTWIVSSGDSRNGTGISILCPDPNYASNAPFVCGINFFNNSIWKYGIHFDNVKPSIAGIYFADTYTGGSALSMKNGLTTGLEFRIPGGNGYIVGNGDHIEVNGGPGGFTFANNARTLALMRVEDVGNLYLMRPDKGVIFTRPDGKLDLLRGGGDGRLRLLDITTGTDRVIGTQAAALTDLPANATLAQVITAYNNLLAAMRASGLLAT